MDNLYTYILYMALAFICAIIITRMMKYHAHNKEMFIKQLNWYISYFGEENADRLIKDLSNNPYPLKALNDIIKDINPELYNKEL